MFLNLTLVLIMESLQVKTCGFPPLEDRNKSVAFCAGFDFFGSGIQTKDDDVSLLAL